MRVIRIEGDFATWREEARRCLQEGVEPSGICWADDAEQGELFDGDGSGRVREESVSYQVKKTTNEFPNALRVPKQFLGLAELVSCHSSPERWGLLYRALWRMTRGGEGRLLFVATDDDIRKLSEMAKEIRRDLHKMRAFVRFRKVGESESGRESFVAWFEPSHHIVRQNAPFFRKRFTGMNWSILTPDECAHWDGEQIHFSPGVLKSEAPSGDELEHLWKSYYRSIFNPARLKENAMRAEMPVKYWKNLPEAELIHDLKSNAMRLREEMIQRESLEPSPVPGNRYLENLLEANAAPASSSMDDLSSCSLQEIRERARVCEACPLHERATQTVFGMGNEDADLMIVGEQPGDLEDLEGRPFAGPAGQLLEEVLEELDLSRRDLYLTNAVKHFKWKASGSLGSRGGPRRLHDRANRAEVHACRPWLLAEIDRVKPKVIVTLGNTAAQSLIRPSFRVLDDRGRIRTGNLVGFEGEIVATVHPAFLLRLPDQRARKEEQKRWRRELKLARTLAFRKDSLSSHEAS